MKKLHLKDVAVTGKRALIRVDFNVPMEAGVISDDRRIRSSLASIRSVLERGGSAVLMTHLGRPEGKGFEAAYSVQPVAKRLAELLGNLAPRGVTCVGVSCIDHMAKDAALTLQPGGVVLLENLRFEKGEKKGDETFANTLASLGDFYVNDAFGTSHRSDASMHAVPLAMRAQGKLTSAGYLLDAELEFLLTRIARAERPFTAILGGAKVSDKLPTILNLMQKVDRIIVGGAMAYTLLRAKGIAIGASRVEEALVAQSKDLLARAAEQGCEILLPCDHLCTTAFSAESARKVCVGAIDDGWMGLDIGPATIVQFATAIRASRTVVWNGPMGVFEMPPFDAGTRAVAQATIDATKTGAITIVGGGDTAAAMEDFGLASQFSHVSTGGGASLEVLEGKHLVCLDAIDSATTVG
ncbi:MAG: phosphoglycerate kinase [Phycisphaerales bacterium]|nr:phosphoglycerate kinase [Phycisphaerales bacterium]